MVQSAPPRPHQSCCPIGAARVGPQHRSLSRLPLRRRSSVDGQQKGAIMDRGCTETLENQKSA